MDRRTDLGERIAAVGKEETVVAELIDRKPIAARTFRPPRLEWFRLDLSPAELADLADAGPPEDPALVQDRPDELPWVADGTHTAAAQLLAALRGEPFPGQEAYPGVRPESEP
ncbi:hypothetical protein BRD03_12465 [Halobacteriales archaeon QS_9_68_17]|nr:MAG: hypothetical protein BRD03_12465 [Halobacteriales archaeon QS_9_68_17]